MWLGKTAHVHRAARQPSWPAGLLTCVLSPPAPCDGMLATSGVLLAGESAMCGEKKGAGGRRLPSPLVSQRACRGARQGGKGMDCKRERGSSLLWNRFRRPEHALKRMSRCAHSCMGKQLPATFVQRTRSARAHPRDTAAPTYPPEHRSRVPAWFQVPGRRSFSRAKAGDVGRRCRTRVGRAWEQAA